MGEREPHEPEELTLGRVAERAVELVPGAEAALLVVRVREGCRVRAAPGYPLDLLAELRIRAEDLDELLAGRFPPEAWPLCRSEPSLRAALAGTRLEAVRARRVAGLWIRGELQGCLTVESLRGPDALPEGGRPLLELLAGTAALVLERLQLRDTVAAHREELELLASAFSHDLKAPLVLIANYAALIQKRMGQAPPSEITDYLERLRGGVRRAEALAKDLTAYLRLGRTVTRKTRVSLDSILEETRGLLAPALEATQARLEARDLPVVEVDRFKIGQVLFNLVDNALKYAGEGRSPRIVVSASSLPGFWRIEVVDDGPGIAPELQPALFKLFARLPEGQRIAPSGTGVGLAVVRRLVEEHGGTVGVDSAPGKGSTFWFTLPATA